MFLSKKILGVRFKRRTKVLMFHYIASDTQGTEYLEKFEIKNGDCNIQAFNTFAKNCLLDYDLADFDTEELLAFCREIYQFTAKKVAKKFKDTTEDLISYTSDDSTAAILSCEAAYA